MFGTGLPGDAATGHEYPGSLIVNIGFFERRNHQMRSSMPESSGTTALRRLCGLLLLWTDGERRPAQRRRVRPNRVLRNRNRARFPSLAECSTITFTPSQCFVRVRGSAQPSARARLACTPAAGFSLDGFSFSTVIFWGLVFFPDGLLRACAPYMEGTSNSLGMDPRRLDPRSL